MQGRTWRRIAVPAFALLAACSSSGTGSNTPQLQSTAERLAPGLLRTAQVRAALDAPTLRPQSKTDVTAYDNPDPRGPCGARVEQPGLRHAAVARFGNRKLGVISVVVEPGARAARAYLDALLADSHAGCPAWESETNTGTTQHVEPRILQLPPIGDQVAMLGGIITIDGVSSLVVNIVVRDGGRLGVSMLVAGRVIDADAVVALARATGASLARLDDGRQSDRAT